MGLSVLLGDTNVFMQEHQITPILKLIDFGVWLNAAQNNWFVLKLLITPDY